MRLSLAFVSVVGLAAAQTTTLYAESGNNWDEWTSADMDTSICVEGDLQSPVNLPTGRSAKNGSLLQGSYKNSISGTYEDIIASGTRLTKTDDDVFELAYTGGSFTHNSHYGMTNIYTSTKIVLRVPAEHQINSEEYAAELQIHHSLSGGTTDQTSQGNLYYSVLFKVDDAATSDDWAEKIFSSSVVPTSKSKPITSKDLKKDIPMAEFMAESLAQNYWQYDGSLNELPCTEDAAWVISMKTYPVTQSTIDMWTSVYSGNSKFASGKGNNRNTQAVTKGKRLIFVQDVGATALFASAAAATMATFASLF